MVSDQYEYLPKLSVLPYRNSICKEPWLSLSQLNSIMGSSHSKPASKKPTRFKKVKTPSCNVFLAADSFGDTTHFDEFMFRSLKISRCYLCNRRVTAADEIVIHNNQRCQAVFHADCMRNWLRRFVDSRGRHSRPACLKCERSLNIRQVKEGRTKQSPLGDFRAF